jgi:hypothetical protein
MQPTQDLEFDTTACAGLCQLTCNCHDIIRRRLAGCFCDKTCTCTLDPVTFSSKCELPLAKLYLKAKEEVNEETSDFSQVEYADNELNLSLNEDKPDKMSTTTNLRTKLDNDMYTVNEDDIGDDNQSVVSRLSGYPYSCVSYCSDFYKTVDVPHYETPDDVVGENKN